MRNFIIASLVYTRKIIDNNNYVIVRYFFMVLYNSICTRNIAPLNPVFKSSDSGMATEFADSSTVIELYVVKSVLFVELCIEIPFFSISF